MTRRPWRQVFAFAIVGAGGLATQLAIFNLLVWLGVGPLTSNAAAVASSIVVAYLGNRYLAFGARRSPRPIREIGRYLLVNAGTLLLAEIILSLGYLSGSQHDPVVLNGLTVLGVLVGSVVRYWAYRRLVFVHEPLPAVVPGLTLPPDRAVPRSRDLMPARFAPGLSGRGPWPPPRPSRPESESRSARRCG